MQRLAFDALDWVDAPMPDGSGPIRLARLPRLADGHFRIFGRFPPGWLRTEVGHYPAFEEILLLEGDLAVGHATLRAGAYAWVAARALRARTASTTGCLAFARFGGAGRWTRGAPDVPADTPSVDLPDVRGASQVLHLSGNETSRIVLRPADLPPHDGPIEWLSIADRTWCFTERGEPAPDLAGPLFVRTLPA